MGVQYMLYMQELGKKRAAIYAAETEKERAFLEQMRELKKKQEKKIKQLEERVENEEYLVHLHDERLKKVRTAKKVVATLKGTGTSAFV